MALGTNVDVLGRVEVYWTGIWSHVEIAYFLSGGELFLGRSSDTSAYWSGCWWLSRYMMISEVLSSFSYSPVLLPPTLSLKKSLFCLILLNLCLEGTTYRFWWFRILMGCILVVLCMWNWRLLCLAWPSILWIFLWKSISRSTCTLAVRWFGKVWLKSKTFDLSQVFLLLLCFKLLHSFLIPFFVHLIELLRVSRSILPSLTWRAYQALIMSLAFG